MTRSEVTPRPQKPYIEIKLSRALLDTLIAAVTESVENIENIPTYDHADEPGMYWITDDDLEAMRHIIDRYSPDADARLLHLDWTGKLLWKARSENAE